MAESTSTAHMDWIGVLIGRIQDEDDGYLLLYDAVRAEVARRAATSGKSVAHAVSLLRDIGEDERLPKTSLMSLTFLVLAEEPVRGSAGPLDALAGRIDCFRSIHRDPSAIPAYRAMAALHIANLSSGRIRENWCEDAISVGGLGVNDKWQLTNLRYLSLCEGRLIGRDESELMRILRYMIEKGYFDTPAAVLWYESVHRGTYQGTGSMKRRMTALLGDLQERESQGPHAFSPEGLMRVEERMAELLAPLSLGEE